MTYEEQMKLIKEVLNDLHSDTYKKAFKNGMLVSRDLIGDFIKKEL